MKKFIDKIALPLGIFLIISLIVGAYYIITLSGNPISETTQPITIDVAGAVVNPGVYTLESKSIIEDAIEKAGGLTNEADLALISKTINRAALLNDHDKVYLPSIVEIEIENIVQQTNNNLININTADLTILDTLPGIGPITASRIIDYRENSGKFKKTEDLMQVEGISSTKYNKLKDLITV